MRNLKKAAAALAIASMPILTACGSGKPPPTNLRYECQKRCAEDFKTCDGLTRQCAKSHRECITSCARQFRL